jgi:hypothetical protein
MALSGARNSRYTTSTNRRFKHRSADRAVFPSARFFAYYACASGS